MANTQFQHPKQLHHRAEKECRLQRDFHHHKQGKQSKIVQRRMREEHAENVGEYPYILDLIAENPYPVLPHIFHPTASAL